MLIPLIAATVSCGGGGAASEPATTVEPKQTVETRSLPGDHDIIARIYDPFFSVPTGFFVDERASTAQSYTIHHVMDESGSYELCTNDFVTAESWEAADNESRSVNGYYVGAYENDRYFEFVRELSYDDDVGNIDDLTSPGFARIFKCSTVSRDGVDRSLLSGFAGQLNTQPIGSSDVREFAEYLWQFAFFPERYKKVLDSYSSTTGGTPGQTLLLGFASSQGFGHCDLVEVVEWRFTANQQSGEVSSQFEVVHSFEAEVVDGSPRLCQ
jgi:hypothetical protein